MAPLENAGWLSPTKIAIWSTTALLSVTLYVLSNGVADLKEVKEGMGRLITRVSLAERDIATNSVNDAAASKRISRLEARVFMMGGALDLPTVSNP